MYYNIKNERIVYMSPYKTGENFTVFLAGYTVKNPDYAVCQSETLPEEINRYQFEYVTSGKGYIETGNKKYRVKKGDLFFFNKGGTRTLYADRDDPFEKKFITVSGKIIDALVEAYKITDKVVIVNTNLSNPIDDALKAVEDAENPDSSNEIIIALHKMIQIIAPAQEYCSYSEYSDPAENIRANIDRHLGVRFTLSDIEDVRYISRCQMIRIFKAKYGITPMQYAIEKRIEKSKYLLEKSRLSVRSISDSLAFTDSRHFSKTFVSHVGMTPTNYRQKFIKKTQQG